MVRPRQIQVLRYISDYWDWHDQAPTGREIAAAFGWHQSSEQFHLDILLGAGMLTRIPGKHRGLTITEAGLGVLNQAELDEP